MIHKLLKKIESIEFSSLLGIASSFNVFSQILHQQSEFQNVIKELLDEPENSWNLLKRVADLSQKQIDDRYENPWDTAIAVYLYALSLTNLELAQTAASFALEARNSWWTKKLANYLLQDKKAGSTGKENITFDSVVTALDLDNESFFWCVQKNTSSKASVNVYNYNYSLPVLISTNVYRPIEKKPSQKLVIGIAQRIENSKHPASRVINCS